MCIWRHVKSKKNKCQSRHKQNLFLDTRVDKVYNTLEFTEIRITDFPGPRGFKKRIKRGNKSKPG